MERLRQLGLVMQQDFCPWANRWVYWIKNPFWSIVLAAIAAGICACFLNPWLWVPTGILCAVALGGLALPLISIRAVDLRVFFDVSTTEVGRPVVVRLVVKNRSWLPIWGLSVIRGLSTPDDGDGGVSLARVPGGSEIEYNWEFQPARRGVYPLGPVEVETGFPFGLIRAAMPASVSGRLIVWPRTVTLKGLPDAAESHADCELSPRRAGHFGDITGTREFRSGDSLRRVHWAQSARRQTLIVNERQAPQSSMVHVVVDLGATAHKGVSHETSEAVISAAASICRSLYQQHCRVECSLGDKLFVVGASPRGLHALMNEFAACEIGGRRRDSARDAAFQIVVTTTAGVSGSPGRRCVSVAETGESTADTWISVVGRKGVFDGLPAAWENACHAG